MEHIPTDAPDPEGLEDSRALGTLYEEADTCDAFETVFSLGHSTRGFERIAGSSKAKAKGAPKGLSLWVSGARRLKVTRTRTTSVTTRSSSCLARKGTVAVRKGRFPTRTNGSPSVVNRRASRPEPRELRSARVPRVEWPKP